MFNTCLFGQPTASPISTAIFTAPPWATFITLLMLKHTLHSTTPLYWKPSSTMHGSDTPPPGWFSSTLRFPLHPACAFTLLCNPCAPPFRLLSVSDISGQATLFSHWGCPSLTQAGLQPAPPWITTDHPLLPTCCTDAQLFGST